MSILLSDMCVLSISAGRSVAFCPKKHVWATSALHPVLNEELLLNPHFVSLHAVIKTNFNTSGFMSLLTFRALQSYLKIKFLASLHLQCYE